MSKQLHLTAESYWLPVATVARLSGRPRASVRLWIDEGKVWTRCDVKTQRVQVWLWSVFDVSDDTARRKRRVA